MALGRELPESFDQALKTAKQILSLSAVLVERGLVDTEAEQIVIAAYRRSEGSTSHLSRAELYSRMRAPLPIVAAQQVVIMAMARAEGRPLQYITGTQAFFDHEYEVGPGVLVPRPETEVLVAQAVSEIIQRKFQSGVGLELGLGSGIISIELLMQFPQLKMIASERSEEARERARRNAISILGTRNLHRLEVLSVTEDTQSCEPFAQHLFAEKADFLVSNPPYLMQGDPIDEDVLTHEPRIALFAPNEPCFFYRQIARQAPPLLKPGGCVLVEMPEFRAIAISSIFRENGWTVRIIPDLAGLDRVLVAEI